MSNKNRSISIIGMIAACVIALAMIILNLYVTIQGFMNPTMPPKVFGYSSLLASDSSMEGKREGSFDKGSMILFKSSESELHVGEVVAYSVKDGGFIIGRITSVNDDGDGRYYRVKGDNIEGEYYEVMTDASYIGSFNAELPFLGALTRFIGTTAGQIIFVWLPGIIGAVCLIWEIWLTIFGIAKAIDGRRDDEDEEAEEKRERPRRERQRREPINLFGWVGALSDWLGELFSRREKPAKTYDAPIAQSKVEDKKEITKPQAAPKVEVAAKAEAAPKAIEITKVEEAPTETVITVIHKAPEVTSLSAVDPAENKGEPVAGDTLLRTVTVTEAVKETVIDTNDVTELAAVDAAEKTEEATAQTTVIEAPAPEAAAIIAKAPMEASAAETPVPEAEVIITKAHVADEPTAVAADEDIELPIVVSDEEEENGGELSFTYTLGGVKLFSQLRKSFMARLIQSSDELKGYYDEVKRELLSYKGVKGRASWGCETFKKGKAHLARINVKVKTLCLYLALDFEEFKDSKYFPTDESGLVKFASTPMMVKIKSERGVRYAKELIAILAERYGLERVKKPITDDFKPPYETTVALIERGLIKDLSGTYAKVSAAEITYPAAEAADTAEATLEAAAVADEIIELPVAAAAIEEEDAGDELSFTYTENGVKLFSMLRKSYMARLIQSSDELKDYYDEVKRELLSYKGVKGRASWGCETFKKTKVHLARINVKMKTLCLYLALDFEEFKDSKYFPTDESGLVKFASTPMMVKIKSKRGVKYAKELIAILAERYGLERVKKPITDDFKPPYETTVALIERGLIKDLSGTYAKVSAAEADTLMSDSHAEKLIVEETAPEVISDRTRRGIVNVDTLSDSFESGEEITLTEMKARIRGFDKRMTYVKVLARGTLSKSLTVHADEFSIQAAKMILLTGGKIIRTKKK